MADSPAPTHPAFSLLLRAHSPDTATRLFATRIAHKPLPLRPSSPTPSGRSLRRIHRNARAAVEKKRAAHKPRPLSAAQKRGMGLFEIPKAQREYRIYEGLHGMWVGYMREILGLDGEGGERNCVSPQGAGVMIASADMHGAEVEVVRSRCVSRVGLRGIVVRDAKFIFEIITKENILKTIPKEHTIFRFEVPLVAKQGQEALKPLVFEINGEQFQHRAPDRAKKGFKMHNQPDL